MSYIACNKHSRDLNQSAADEQFSAAESLDGQAGHDSRCDSQDVNADSERSGTGQSTITEDLL